MFLTVADLDVDGASLDLGTCGVAVIGTAAPGRRRWTAAHELGHYLLRHEYHADIGVSASRDEREQLVDAFAGELLVPTEDLFALAAGDSGDLREALLSIAVDYRVSWSAVVDRARQAGVIDAATAKELRVLTPVRGDLLAAAGREPQPDLPIGDHGESWTKAVLRAYHQDLVTRERVVELLGGRVGIDELPEPGGVEPW